MSPAAGKCGNGLQEIKDAFRLGTALPQHELIEVAGKAVMLSRRFDRNDAVRVPFLSAMGYCPYLTLSVLS